jgi:hypothetical protein
LTKGNNSQKWNGKTGAEAVTQLAKQLLVLLRGSKPAAIKRARVLAGFLGELSRPNFF